MVFYIEACESGSMMNHLADNINGEQSVNLLKYHNLSQTKTSIYCDKNRLKARLCRILAGEQKKEILFIYRKFLLIVLQKTEKALISWK